MKRTPLRRTRLKRRPPRRLSRPGADPAYRSWVHDQPCVVAGQFSPEGNRHHCEGRIEQSHERDMTGIGRKEPDRRSLAMCSRAHQEWEQHRGFFAHWSKELRREWMRTRVVAANARFDAERAA